MMITWVLRGLAGYTIVMANGTVTGEGLTDGNYSGSNQPVDLVCFVCSSRQCGGRRLVLSGTI